MLSLKGKKMELHLETLLRRRSPNLLPHAAGQLLDSISLKDAPGADDDGLDQGGDLKGRENENQQVHCGQALTLTRRWTT